jgi:outer membrane protein OmpA-like peptidoglycan-associated protein
MKGKSSAFFWPSFTDLMTSLFFIMLVLYVLTFIKLKIQQQATEAQLNKIKEIQSAVRELPQKYFTYQPEYKRFSLNEQIQFGVGKSDIREVYTVYLFEVGRSIQNLIVKLKSQYQNENIKYLIVIEGMASNDGYIYNDDLSFQRALSLFKFWKNKGIVFDPNFCELQIAGSGIGGIGRYAGKEEYKNQRFLIQIVPKIGDIKIE